MSKTNQAEQKTELERLEQNIRQLDAKAAHLKARKILGYDKDKGE